MGSSYYLFVSYIAVFLVVKFRTIRKNPFNPTFLCPLVFCTYILIGAPNISSYRGEITDTTLNIFFVSLLIIWISTEIAGVIPALKTKPKAPQVRLEQILLLSLPGIAGVLMMVPHGIPLFNPVALADVPAKSVFLTETIFAPYILLLERFYFKKKIQKSRNIELTALALFFFMLALPGYRGWIIIAALLWVTASFRSSNQIKFSKTIILAILIVGVMVGIAIVRRTLNPSLLGADDVLNEFDAQALGPTFGLLHFALRESIAISQSLLTSNITLPEGVLLSDFLTMLPGKRLSGGEIVAQAFNEFSGVGLTPGAVGALASEFSLVGGLALLALISFTIGYLHKTATRSGRVSAYLGYLLCTMYFLHYLHRGIPKPAYVFVPLLLMTANLVFRRPLVKPIISYA